MNDRARRPPPAPVRRTATPVRTGAASSTRVPRIAPPLAPRLVVVGTSWGGLNALSTILAGLPADFSLPIAIVQHRGREAGDTMATFLQGLCRRPVREAEDTDPLQAGYVYVAPADYHLLVDEGCLSLSVDPPVAFSRPSIDVLFESAADAYGAGVIGVLLTGANQDGAAGLARIKAAGGYTIVQDPSTAEVPVMPQSAIDRISIDDIVALPAMSPLLVELARSSSGLVERGAQPAARGLDSNGARAGGSRE